MKKIWILLGLTSLLSLFLTGCGGDDNAAKNGNKERQGAQIQQVRAGDVNSHQNHIHTISDRAKQQVEGLKDVEEAHVIISNNNAYVAVRLVDQNKATGENANNGINEQNPRKGNGIQRDTHNQATVGNRAAEIASLENNFSEASNEFELKIANQIRQLDKNIQNVYISMNPYMFERMGAYEDDLKTNGKTEGLYEGLNNPINNSNGIQTD